MQILFGLFIAFPLGCGSNMSFRAYSVLWDRAVFPDCGMLSGVSQYLYSLVIYSLQCVMIRSFYVFSSPV